MYPKAVRCGMLFACLVGHVFAQSVWTGASFTSDFNDPTNWYAQNVPPTDGSAILRFGPGFNDTVTLPATFGAQAIVWEGQDETLTIQGNSTLDLGSSGIIGGGSSYFGRLRFGSNVTINLTGNTTFDLGLNSGQSVVISGVITGSGPLNLANGAFLFNRVGSGNTYTGNTVIGTGTSGVSNQQPTVTVWNSSPFGTGSVFFQNGATFAAYNNPTIANAVTFNNSGSGSPAPVQFRGADTALTFSGAITLAGPTSLQSVLQPANYRGNEGYVPQPGPSQRNPVIFTGAIGESGGARKLSLNGPSYFIIDPTSGVSSWTGGTDIGVSGSSGAVVFGSASAVPAVGNITVGSNGYAGAADAATFTALLAHMANTSQQTGAIGFDTLPGAGSTTAINSGTIDLSAFTLGNMRLGTATKAVIGSGVTITPKNNVYQFGNGGGELTVQTSLADGGSARSLVLSGSGAAQLRLVMQGTNTYTLGTTASVGQLVFDSANAVPANGLLTATGNGYIGMTENVALTPAQFLARFNQGATTGTIGFDSSNPLSPYDFTGAVDLTAFGTSAFIGTSSAARLSGSITATTIDNVYRFTAARGGRLEVASNLSSGGAVIGFLNSGNVDQSSNGIVALTGTNTYSGDTNLRGNFITAEFGSNSAFGTGTLQVEGTPGLAAGTNGLNLGNAINLVNFSTLNLVGSHDFTLSGNITGPGLGGGSLLLADPDNLTVSLTGNNAGWNGNALIYQGTISLDSVDAAGLTRFYLLSPNATLNITQSVTLHGLGAQYGHVGIADGKTLILDVTDDDDSRDFEVHGSLGGIGGGSTTADVVVTGQLGHENEAVFMRNANAYTGGTTILGAGAVGMGHADALGTGAVWLNAPEGGLALAPGVTFVNHLTFDQGALAGGGTFAASNLSLYNFGAGRGVAPGFPGIADIVAGKLTLSGNAEFADNGFFIWSLQDAGIAGGSTQLNVTGMLSLTATSGLFKVTLQSFGADGDDGYALNFNSGNPYTWTIATAAGGITGFDPSRFTIDTTGFWNPLAGGAFSLSQSGNDLLLSFTPVPEPSTYALLALGLGLVALRVRRRF